jgi:hypothetical protein
MSYTSPTHGCNPSESSSLYLNADDLAKIIFNDSQTSVQIEYLENFDVSTIDVKTLFEMLLMITTYGLKQYYGNDDGKVDITNLTETEITTINAKLSQINIQLIVDMVSRIDWHFGKQIVSYDQINITNKTVLSELKAVFDRGDYIIIWFNRLSK